MSKLNFSVELAGAPTEAAEEAKDPRGLVERLFTKFDKKTGEVTPMPLLAINCATQTPSDQGLKSWDLANTIPVMLSYKSGVGDFKGQSKGRDFVIIGKRPGRGGSAGLMVDIQELDSFIENVQQLRDALSSEVVNNLRSEAGLPARPVAAVPPTEEG